MNDIFFFGIISLVIDLDKVYLDNFVLEDYDEFDYNHKCTIMELSDDIDARNYLYDVKGKMDAVKRRSEDNPLNLAYVAFYNDYPIGIITLSYINREYYISYGICQSIANSIWHRYCYKNLVNIYLRLIRK